MGWSGLIYAAIVAGWAAVLVPRWVRRNEEAERAKAADALAGVRVLERRGRPVSGPSTVTGDRARRSHVLHAPHPPLPDLPPRLATASRDERGSARLPAPRILGHSRTEPVPRSPAARRRRALATLGALLLIAFAGVVAGLLPSVVLAFPAVLLAGFVALARVAVRREASLHRQRARARRRPHGGARRRAETVHSPDDLGAAASHADADAPPGPAVTVTTPAWPDTEAERADGAWDPVPVPLPTYVTAPKAPRVIRRIDLSTPGAWTSGGPSVPTGTEHEDDPGAGGFPVLPPVVATGPAHTGVVDPVDGADDEGFEHRRAVGD